MIQAETPTDARPITPSFPSPAPRTLALLAGRSPSRTSPTAKSNFLKTCMPLWSRSNAASDSPLDSNSAGRLATRAPAPQCPEPNSVRQVPCQKISRKRNISINAGRDDHFRCPIRPPAAELLPGNAVHPDPPMRPMPTPPETTTRCPVAAPQALKALGRQSRAVGSINPSTFQCSSGTLVPSFHSFVTRRTRHVPSASSAYPRIGRLSVCITVAPSERNVRGVGFTFQNRPTDVRDLHRPKPFLHSRSSALTGRQPLMAINKRRSET